jgi:2-methylcitrate dehydratase PrpD
MMAVEWAECGIGGSLTAFHDGFTDLLGGALDPGVLTDDLGDYWGIRDGYTKIHACCQHVHAAVEAVVALRPELPADPAVLVDAIEVETHPLGMLLLDAEPRTTLGAKFSMPHAVAAALVTGSSGMDAFSRASLEDASIRALRPRVKVLSYAPLPPAPNDRPARVRVRLKDGREFERECLSALGGPDRPLPADTVWRKMDVLAGPVYPKMREVLENLSPLAPASSMRGWRDIIEEFA